MIEFERQFTGEHAAGMQRGLIERYCLYSRIASINITNASRTGRDYRSLRAARRWEYLFRSVINETISRLWRERLMHADVKEAGGGRKLSVRFYSFPVSSRMRRWKWHTSNRVSYSRSAQSVSPANLRAGARTNPFIYSAKKSLYIFFFRNFGSLARIESWWNSILRIITLPSLKAVQSSSPRRCVEQFSWTRRDKLFFVFFFSSFRTSAASLMEAKINFANDHFVMLVHFIINENSTSLGRWFGIIIIMSFVT